ncbi:hypothetical protein AMJ44_02965 [candidate division WOR-1 bacterium DG_54_3]|uniref:TonB-dependent receptor-like beta-barrel domain-containing protein n=1 Tax=candidate division WOR-1 bacterium DG_54_3 TaxID=1703775 RepID=A0A0S7Y4K0_UNCSA|nr:MAG: hypothetical protein AMJ44_02965 [candidate division WOR-1 bacterium DG_54_3]
MRRIFIILTLLVVAVSANIVSAQTGSNDTEQLNAEILQLQRQIIEMEKKHKTQIDILKKQIDELAAALKQKKQQDEAASLRQLAKAEAGQQIIAEEKPEETVFEAGGLALQALNPEISVTGDFLFSTRQDTTSDESSDFDFRTLGIHIESWLDPYTRFKAAIPVTESDAKLGEGYVTLYNIASDLNLTLGKFRQQFGVVNRWHKHGLDQVDFPLTLRKIFGEGGLNQTGLSLDWLMLPIGQASQQLTFQVTDGSNSRLFGQNTRNRPSILAHYKNYRDLSKDTYMEWGLTGLIGWNDEWDIYVDTTQNSSQETFVLGADLSILWEPTEKMRYRNLEWRSEAYWLNKRLLAPDASGDDNINAWGLYSYLQSKISRTIDVGMRGDFYVPDTKSYANISDSLSLSPLAVTGDNPYLWQISPYITWWQSPFVKFRAEYDYSNGKRIENPEHTIWLQCVFSAGPHKHERY